MQMVECQHGIPESAIMDAPFIIGAQGLTESWASDKTMQAAMHAFGGKYKKQKQYEAELKTTQPLQAKQGKEVTESYFDALLKLIKSRIVDVSTVSQSWMATSWQFGVAPNFQSASLTPNSASSIRIMCQGKLHIYAMAASLLVAAMRKEDPNRKG
eukprot:12484225-Alexandrium_andersonii.AAC.1